MEESIKIVLQEHKGLFQECRDKLILIEKSLKIAEKEERLKAITQLESDSDIWNDTHKAAELQKEKSQLTTIVDHFQLLQKMVQDYEVLQEFALGDGDQDSAQEALQLFPRLQKEIDSAEHKVLLSQEMDFNNAILNINAGAGGTESCDWAHMLWRMIVRWSENRKFRIKTLDVQGGETAGIKSATLLIEGPYAFGLLKSESGIHRLVRISPFDSNARRHTSFASIFVTPELDDNIEIEILDKDLRIEVYRSGGAGGQSVNTTDSAVRITHIPSHLVVTCQNERSQLQNKLFAMKILRSRLYEREVEARKKEQEKIEGEKKEIGWGSQIRSYVLHPYKLVKDHRTNWEVGNADRVLDGDIDDFIKAYLQWQSQQGQSK